MPYRGARAGEDDVDLFRLLVAVTEGLVLRGAHDVIGEADRLGAQIPAGETGLLAAVQAFEGVGFTQPVVGIVGAQANGFIGGTQGFIVAA